MEEKSFKNNPHPMLMWKLFGLYLGVALFGMFIITLDNIFIGGKDLVHLAKFNLLAILVQAMLLAASFQVITLIRFREINRFLHGGKDVELATVWLRLVRFPTEMFWGMIIFGLITGPLYHLLEIKIQGVVGNLFWGLLKSFLFEQTLVLILAVLLYALLRFVLRPYVISLPSWRLQGFPQITLLKPLLISFISLLFITILSPIIYILRITATGNPVNLKPLFGIAGFAVFFSLLILAFLATQFRNELRLLIQGILALLEGEGAWLQRRMPIISQDELGQLGVAFNQLQEHVSLEYQVLEKELQLAHKVQQQLLPPAYHDLGAYRIAALCQPTKKVGGDFYDILPLDGERFAVVIGDVAGNGLPAALVMSAMLVLLRTEVRRGGTAAEVLNRLNQIAVDTLQGEMCLTLGLAIFDKGKSVLEYASAGHVAPYLLRGAKVKQVLSSSFPLGLAEQEKYYQVLLPLVPGDRFIFYTDGIVEAFNSQGEMVGFHGLELYFSALEEIAAVEDQLNALVAKLPPGSKSDDDKTIVMVQYLQPVQSPATSCLC